MRDEHGFTMVELLVTMSLVGIISAAITATLVVGLRTTDDTRRRVADARDTQLTAAYFIADVQSATDVSLTDAACAGEDPLVRFRWDEAGVQHDVAYVVRTVGMERRLTRRACEGGSPARDLDVAHGLDAAVDPVVTCAPACTATPDKVSIEVTEATGFSYSLSGARRAA